MDYMMRWHQPSDIHSLVEMRNDAADVVVQLELLHVFEEPLLMSKVMTALSCFAHFECFFLLRGGLDMFCVYMFGFSWIQLLRHFNNFFFFLILLLFSFITIGNATQNRFYFHFQFFACLSVRIYETISKSNSPLFFLLL